jgi:AcrR family transcriptional regulator
MDREKKMTTPTGAPAPAAAGGARDERAERILDAAADLLVAWGYRRVTIDEVARRADVGKGTVYLHFSTKEVLFLTVTMRAQARLIDLLLEHIAADPSAILLSRFTRFVHRMVHDDPLIRAMVTADSDTLGSLVRSAPGVIDGVMAERARSIGAYLAVLREHGLIRTDEPADRQQDVLTAVLLGFLIAPLYTPWPARPPEERADLLEGTVRAVFETGADLAAVPAAAAEVARVFERVRGVLRAEIDRQKRT